MILNLIEFNKYYLPSSACVVDMSAEGWGVCSVIYSVKVMMIFSRLFVSLSSYSDVESFIFSGRKKPYIFSHIHIYGIRLWMLRKIYILFTQRQFHIHCKICTYERINLT